jgi:hypothetical protein
VAVEAVLGSVMGALVALVVAVVQTVRPAWEEPAHLGRAITVVDQINRPALVAVVRAALVATLHRAATA